MGTADEAHGDRTMPGLPEEAAADLAGTRPLDQPVRVDERADREQQTVDATRALLVAGPAALLPASGIAWLLGGDDFGVAWMLGAWAPLTVGLAALVLRRRR